MQPPKMTQALEDRLRMMFRDIQEPFNKNCPDVIWRLICRELQWEYISTI